MVKDLLNVHDLAFKLFYSKWADESYMDVWHLQNIRLELMIS